MLRYTSYVLTLYLKCSLSIRRTTTYPVRSYSDLLACRGQQDSQDRGGGARLSTGHQVHGCLLLHLHVTFSNGRHLKKTLPLRMYCISRIRFHLCHHNLILHFMKLINNVPDYKSLKCMCIDIIAHCLQCKLVRMY